MNSCAEDVRGCASNAPELPWESCPRPRGREHEKIVKTMGFVRSV